MPDPWKGGGLGTSICPNRGTVALTETYGIAVMRHHSGWKEQGGTAGPTGGNEDFTGVMWKVFRC